MATLEAAVAGAIASSLANIAIYPLDLAKTLVQTQLEEDDIDENQGTKTKNTKYKNALDCIYRVFRSRGVKGLYRGMSTSILASFIQSFCYFFWYTFIRKRYFKIKAYRTVPGKSVRFNTLEELALGMIAAATSQLFTNPVSVVSTRQQTISSDSSEDSKVTTIVKQIIKEQNGSISGLWKGLKVSLVLTINPSITYASYQKLKNVLFGVDAYSIGGKQLTAGQNFILGVFSKMISTVITQPLIVSKGSLQKAGSKFRSFQQVLKYLYMKEGLLALWKGLRPQLMKGVLVQGLLFMFKGELSKVVHTLVLQYSKQLRQ